MKLEGSLREEIKRLLKTTACSIGGLLSQTQQTDYTKIVFCCNYGRGLLCNPKYIAKALNDLYPEEFDEVLLVNTVSSNIPAYIRQVRKDSVAAQKELATARFWVDNSRMPKYVGKRQDQIYIQTWHACLGPKKCERDVEEHLDPSYVWNARRDGGFTDLMIADNRLEATKYQRAFWYEGPVLKCGMPRNKPLLRRHSSLHNKVHKVLGVPDDRAICLYAPTFRVDGSVDEYRFDFDLAINLLQQKYGKPFAFVYRLHPNLANAERPSFLEGYVDATQYMDTQELLAATDVLISDYSSIMEDFVLTGRPGFTYVPDLEEYMDDRGLYYPLSDRPYPVVHSEEELISAIRDFNPKLFESKRADFLSRAGFVEDGEGDLRVARLIHELSVPGTTLEGTLTTGDVWSKQV